MKLDKFKNSIFWQPENVLDISVTLEVIKLVKSKDVNKVQLKNIEDIEVTCEVFKFVIFNVLSDLQP